MSVTVVTDSAASLPREAAAELGVVVVPMTLVVGGIQYADGDLSPGELLTRLQAEAVTTASPSPGDIVKRIEDQRGDDAVILTISSQMSATYDVARTACRYLGEDRVRVVDTRTAAGGQGLVVIAAAEAAARGASLDEVVEVAQGVAARVRLVASLQSLDALARSGRVPGAAAWAGRFLGVRPLFEFGEGQARPLRPALSQQAALDRIVGYCLKEKEGDAQLIAAVLHAQAPELAQEVSRHLAESEPTARLFAAPFSSVMVAHTGPGLIGLAWWWSKGD